MDQKVVPINIVDDAPEDVQPYVEALKEEEEEVAAMAEEDSQAKYNELTVSKSRRIRIAHLLNDRILVDQLPEPEVSSGGVFLPELAREHPCEGTVVAIGTGRVTQSGVTLPLKVQVNDTVLYGKFTGTKIEIEGKPYIVLREDEVLAILRDSGEVE